MSYYTLVFSNHEDLKKVIRDGPLFTNGHFLTICKGESLAKFSSVAEWIHIRELPFEYYASRALHKISEAIGPLLRVDTYTVTIERGRFPRLYVQVKSTSATCLHYHN